MDYAITKLPGCHLSQKAELFTLVSCDQIYVTEPTNSENGCTTDHKMTVVWRLMTVPPSNHATNQKTDLQNMQIWLQ